MVDKRDNLLWIVHILKKEKKEWDMAVNNFESTRTVLVMLFGYFLLLIS